MISFRPKMGSTLWEMKCQITFDSVDEMKKHIAEQETKFRHFIGIDKLYRPEDVILKANADWLSVWKSCFEVILDGVSIGTCGE